MQMATTSNHRHATLDNDNWNRTGWWYRRLSRMTFNFTVGPHDLPKCLWYFKDSFWIPSQNLTVRSA